MIRPLLVTIKQALVNASDEKDLETALNGSLTKLSTVSDRAGIAIQVNLAQKAPQPSITELI